MDWNIGNETFRTSGGSQGLFFGNSKSILICIPERPQHQLVYVACRHWLITANEDPPYSVCAGKSVEAEFWPEFWSSVTVLQDRNPVLSFCRGDTQLWFSFSKVRGLNVQQESPSTFWNSAEFLTCSAETVCLNEAEAKLGGGGDKIC